MTVNEILEQCTISGNVVFLPNIQLDRKLYQDVAKKIELIGGKWDRKTKGFLFKQDPRELFEAIKNGENKNLKKEYQFFETPKELARQLVTFLELDTKTVLEPSAGQGAIVRAVNESRPQIRVSHCELMELNRMQFVGDSELVGEDFLALPLDFQFDAVIANPPFAKNQDIDHFHKMLQHARKKIICIMSNHWRFSQNKKETAFREFLEANQAMVLDLPAGTFKDSGTNVSACVVVLNIAPKY